MFKLIKPKQDNKDDKSLMEKRLANLEQAAISAEERAEYAEKELVLRKRIFDAKMRIAQAQPPSGLENLSMKAIMPKSKGAKVALGIIAVLILILIMVKSC